MVRSTRGVEEDLLVRDGLLGTDLVYNRFEAL